MGDTKKETKKFQHIGGESEAARVAYLNTDTKFKQAVADLAAQYKVPAKLVFSRLVREGVVDEAIHRNNALKGQPFVSIMDDPTYTDKDGIKHNLNNPYSYFGMDTAGGRMRQGRIKTNRPIPVEYYMENNGLEDVETFNTNNIYDALELNVADIAARRNAAKKLYPKASEDELNEITGAFYNNSILTAKELVKNGEHRTKYKIDKDIEGLKIPKARTYPLRKDNVNYDGYAQLNPLSVTPKEGDPNAPLYSQELQGEAYADFKERERQKQIDSYNATHNIPYGTSIPSYYNPYIDEGNMFPDGGEMETKAAKNQRIANDIGAVGGAATQIISSSVQASKIGDTSNIENQIKQSNADSNNLSFSSNEELMNQWGNTYDIGHVGWRDIRGMTKAGMAGSAISSTASGAAAGMQVGGPWGAAAGAVVGLGSALAGIFTGNKKAKRKARRLNAQIDAANLRKDVAFGEAADDLNEENAMMIENNYAAFGGDLQTHGGDFPTGIISIDEGGTHESNVNGGVPMGMDAQGIPNLVEQGEVVYNDYVFSDRLKVPKGMRGKYGKRKDITFADAAKKISKESEERPNDPISKLGLEKQMTELMMGQEFVRASMPKNNSYACGGHKKDGTDTTQSLDNANSAEFYYRNITPEQWLEYINNLNLDDYLWYNSAIKNKSRSVEDSKRISSMAIMYAGSDDYDQDEEGFNRYRQTWKDWYDKEKAMGDLGFRNRDYDTYRKVYETVLRLRDYSPNRSLIEIMNSADYGSRSAMWRELRNAGINEEDLYVSNITPELLAKAHHEYFMDGQYQKDKEEIEGWHKHNMIGSASDKYERLRELINQPNNETFNWFRGLYGNDAAINNLSDEDREKYEAMLTAYGNYLRVNPTPTQTPMPDTVATSTGNETTYKTESEINDPEFTKKGRDLAEIVITSKQESAPPLDWTKEVKQFQLPLNDIKTDNSSYDTFTKNMTQGLFDSDKTGDNTVKLAEVKDTESTPKDSPTWMRYVPAIGSGINAFTDALGLTNKPDYTAAKAIEGIVNRSGANRVSFTPLGNYLQYKPLDRDYYTNKLRSQAAASRNAIMQGSSPSRYAAALASDYNTIQGLGKLAREAEEYNFNNRRAVAEFNRATDQANSEGFLRAAMANQSELANLRDFRLKGTMAAQEMRQKAKAASDAERNKNWSTFLKNMGAIGTENKSQNQLNWLIRNNYFPKYKN